MDSYQLEQFSNRWDYNITYPPYPSADWGVFTAYGFILILGIFGNLSIIILVLYDNSLRNVANLLIANIAVSDFLVMVLCVPSTMVLNVRHSYPGGLLYCQAMFSTQVISACLSSLTLAALSYERYRVITNPLGDRANLPRVGATRTFVLAWTISIAVGIPVFITTSDFYMEMGSYSIHSCEYVPHYTLLGKCLKTLIFLATFALPCVPLAFFNFRISRCLVATLRENKRMLGATSSGAEIQARSRRKLAVIVCVMVFVFVASWLPFHLFVFAQEFGSDRFREHPVTHEINKLILIPPYLSSAVNPWVMYAMSTGYRQKFLAMIRCRRESRRQPHPSRRRVRLRVILSSKLSTDTRSRTTGSSV